MSNGNEYVESNFQMGFQHCSCLLIAINFVHFLSSLSFVLLANIQQVLFSVSALQKLWQGHYKTNKDCNPTAVNSFCKDVDGNSWYQMSLIIVHRIIWVHDSWEGWFFFIFSEHNQFLVSAIVCNSIGLVCHRQLS